MAEADLDYVPTTELPPDLETFLRFQETAIQEADNKRQERIREILGGSSNPADIQEAENLAEEEILATQQKTWPQQLETGLITIIPPEPKSLPIPEELQGGDLKAIALGKSLRIALRSDNPTVFSFFNMAVREVTDQYGGFGFQQIGNRNKTGMSSWELRSTEPPKSHELIQATFRIMQEMNPTPRR